MHKFLSSLAEYPVALAFLCCLSLTHILPAWLLPLTLYMSPFIYISFLCLLFWTVILSAASKSILSQSRCSLEPKNFLRVLHPLKPLLGSHSTPRSPSSVDAHIAQFSVDYICSWYHVWYLHIEPAMHKHFLKKTNLFRELMKKFVVLLTKEIRPRMNGKMTPTFFLRTILFQYFTR